MKRAGVPAALGRVTEKLRAYAADEAARAQPAGRANVRAESSPSRCAALPTLAAAKSLIRPMYFGQSQQRPGSVWWA